MTGETFDISKYLDFGFYEQYSSRNFWSISYLAWEEIRVITPYREVDVLSHTYPCREGHTQIQGSEGN